MNEVTAATCKIRAAHTPHGQCPGTAPEFPWERVVIPAGTLMRRVSAPAEEFVVVAADFNLGDEYATVRYFGGQGHTWAERAGNLVCPKFNAVAF